MSKDNFKPISEVKEIGSVSFDLTFLTPKDSVTPEELADAYKGIEIAMTMNDTIVGTRRMIKLKALVVSAEFLPDEENFG